MSQRTKCNTFIITIGAIFLFFTAPSNIFSMLLLVAVTTVILTGIACFFVPKAP